MKKNKNFFRLAILSATMGLYCLWNVTSVYAATINVSSIAQLQSAINNAAPGDNIIVANGTYTSSSTINVACMGTSSAKITIAAQSVGGATISGTGAFSVNSPSAYVVIRGFRFIQSSGMVIKQNTSNCLITRNHFELSGGASYLTVSGTDNEISYNAFVNKSTNGAFLILDEDTKNTLRPYAHHNYFYNHTYSGSNGGEAIRVFSILPRVEYNLFEEVHVHGEIISSKDGGGSQGAFYRYNTFRNCTNGQITLRSGQKDVIEGNFFINSEGIRAYGRDQVIRNNYFDHSHIQLGDGLSSSYYSINRMDFTFNTLIETAFDHSERSGIDESQWPNNVTIANNIIIKSSGTFLSNAKTMKNTKYEGNIFWGDATVVDIPSSGYKKADPKMVKDAGGIYRPASTSPAFNAAAGSYPLAIDDMDGQSRVGTKDVGADEYSTDPVTRKALTASDVGPNASINQPSVTLYQNNNYGGWAASFGVGSYTTAQLLSGGAKNNDASSIKVPNGLQVTLYDGDNFTGSSLVLTADNSTLGNQNFNDKMSSMKITSLRSASVTSVAASQLKLQISQNPVSESTNININTTETGLVTLAVYDLNGKMVKNLMNEVKEAGEYVRTFNVSDLQGGVYIIQLTSGNKTNTIKVIVSQK